MATELLYQSESYERSLDATVVERAEAAVALDRTIFYPTGGGQPNDVGTISSGDESWKVVDVRRGGETVWHELDRAGPELGTVVSGRLDWERRYELMRTNTAMHILCGVIWRDYEAKVTGGNMQPLAGRMDFEFEQMKAELVHDIEEKVNEEVAAARPISVRFMPRAEADAHPDLIRTKISLLPPEITIVRVVDIDGLDVQADGGTHVSNTHEVGPIEIVGYKSKGRANKRFEIELAPGVVTGPTS